MQAEHRKDLLILNINQENVEITIILISQSNYLLN